MIQENSKAGNLLGPVSRVRSKARYICVSEKLTGDTCDDNILLKNRFVCVAEVCERTVRFRKYFEKIQKVRDKIASDPYMYVKEGKEGIMEKMTSARNYTWLMTKSSLVFCVLAPPVRYPVSGDLRYQRRVCADPGYISDIFRAGCGDGRFNAGAQHDVKAESPVTGGFLINFSEIATSGSTMQA